jgi:DNA gyrase/topoisomerase IV subunit A
LEEVDFFHEICLIALYASRSVKFAAVVDSKGKLILAKFKRFNMHSHRTSISPTPRILDCAQQQQAQTLLPQSCYSFCHEYLMPTLKDMTSRSYREQYSNTAHFEISEIDKNIGLKLAVTPLTESRDKYLCLYLQLPPKMRTDGHQQIISKLTNVIQ